MTSTTSPYQSRTRLRVLDLRVLDSPRLPGSLAHTLQIRGTRKGDQGKGKGSDSRNISYPPLLFQTRQGRPPCLLQRATPCRAKPPAVKPPSVTSHSKPPCRFTRQTSPLTPLPPITSTPPAQLPDPHRMGRKQALHDNDIQGTPTQGMGIRRS